MLNADEQTSCAPSKCGALSTCGMHRAVPNLEEQTLLWVHGCYLGRSESKERGVEALYAGQEAAKVCKPNGVLNQPAVHGHLNYCIPGSSE